MRNILEQIIAEVSLQLTSEDNIEWVERYNGYLDDINKYAKNQIDSRRLFRPEPFTCYSSISRATKLKGEFDLRFKGQSVATITVDKNSVVQFTPKHETNNQYFGCDIQGTYEWDSVEATHFRSHFSNLTGEIKTKSPEHTLENLLLNEFAKTSSQEKSLCNIQPIRLNGCYLQIPTPLSASKKDSVNYAKQYGGGIDIMARVRMRNNDVRLTIFELKDENTEKEPATVVIKQAVAYGVFIAHLLANNPNWWMLFGYSKEPIERRRVINIATLMPPSSKPELIEFENMKLSIGNGYELELHTLYFDEATNSFTGSLKDNMLER